MLGDELIKFYSACVVEILDCLHKQNIVHREVYPGAFVIGDQGYLYADELRSIRNLARKDSE